MIIIYIDENISPYLAEALNVLEKRDNNISVKSIQNTFDKGTKDPDLILKMGKQQSVWVTKDKSLLKNGNELKLILEYEIGLFILTPYWSKMKYWDQVTKLISIWEEIKELSINSTKPFAYRIEGNKKIQKIDRIKSNDKK